MSDLAYNINGESFELPGTASGWRVRRMKQRGAPEVVYGRDGVPLVIPIESDLEELRRNIDAPGRFRLDAVDERGRSIEDVPAAYVQVASLVDAPGPLATSATPAVVHQGTDGIVAEAMRLNTELARSIIDRFPEMMSAAAELLRAADGAGLPRREPRVVDDDDDEEDEAPAASTSPSFELISNLITQIVPVVVGGLAGKKMNLSSVLDWRKASAEGQQAKEQATPGDVAAATEPMDASPSADALPPLDPKTMGHFIAIQAALAPNEAALAKQVAAELSPAELRAWIDELAALSVPDAVAKIRSMLGGTPKKGSAS